MDHMAQALELASRALGRVSPNPAVGAVIVREGVVVGEGFTQPPGSDHAEVVALKQAGEAARGATMYVTLEPCPHFGRTPPCSRAIIAAGVAEVHMATLDPNPQVAGRGRAELEEAGIATFLGEHEEEARQLNEAYLKHVTTGLPFVIAKFAASLDGKIATRRGDSRWISGEEGRARAHQLRDQVDAVMVGVGTVLADDPRLTARPRGMVSQRQPLRVVVDSRGRIPPEARLLGEPGRTLIAATDRIPPEKAAALRDAGAEVLILPENEGKVDLRSLFQHLGERPTISVLAEGGGTILGSLFDEGLVDKVVAFIAPLIIGGREAPSAVDGRGIEAMARAMRLSQVQVERLGADIMISGYPTRGERGG